MSGSAIGPTPDASDELVQSAAELHTALSAATGAVSLRIEGLIKLSEWPEAPIGQGPTILPWISGSRRLQSVTLWSLGNATIDAEGRGRIFFVEEGGRLRLENLHLTNGRTGPQFGGGCVWIQSESSVVTLRGVRLSNCTTTGEAGGGLFVVDARLSVEDCTFERCEVSPARGSGYGGGLGMFSRALVEVHRTTFDATRVVSDLFTTYGGGAGVAGGTLLMERVRFVWTSVTSESNLCWGGGLGMIGGMAAVGESEWLGASATSVQSDAWGGGVGMRMGGRLDLSDSALRLCRVAGGRRGDGGGIGGGEGSEAELFNVLIEGAADGLPSPSLCWLAERARRVAA